MVTGSTFIWNMTIQFRVSFNVSRALIQNMTKTFDKVLSKLTGNIDMEHDRAFHKVSVNLSANMMAIKFFSLSRWSTNKVHDYATRIISWCNKKDSLKKTKYMYKIVE